ncbi:hypothetical protein DL766_002763 [Monosporascus sp. MC13-8B]|uniref:SnoaL-like domain-containing protein n=1 Tax=Monosporascus cannonballus TaxID=155416 RepID=A0ABY0HMY8_9PEZI|nr:hypothetical protein DL762_000511 [Monosporascus cannonballus]RYO96022.1 hypothetical protein DL763_003414 [Monosporascus cannonballus]RYP34865.1 hypothetical protein DL766_002763 [Monosporascus sp. MC13-8B]
MSLRENMIATAKQWIKAHNDRNATGEAGITSFAAPDFVARSFPSSLQAPDRNCEEYAAFQSWAFTLLDTYSATEVDMVVDETQRKVVYYLNAKGTAPAGEYKNEYIQKLTLTEDGKLIKEFDAFVDSQAMVTWMGKAQAAQGAKEQGK